MALNLQLLNPTPTALKLATNNLVLTFVLSFYFKTDSIVQRNINGLHTRLLLPDIVEELGRNTG
jgi:hypothetical protein